MKPALLIPPVVFPGAATCLVESLVPVVRAAILRPLDLL